MRRRLCAGLLLFVIAGHPVLAGEPDYLFRRCMSPAAAGDPVCTRYVYGVLNAPPAQRFDTAPRRSTCYPQVVSPAQANAIVQDYVRRYPERLATGAANVRAEAFQSAFPCRTN
jgi:hypothetical protein